MSTPNTLDLIRSLLILILLYLSYIDLRSFRLPDFVTLPLILTGILFNLLSSVGFTDAASATTGAVLGYGSLWLLNRLYRLSKKQDGMGMGDAKLLAALGAWLGWAALPSILLIASVSGLIGGLIYLKWRKKVPIMHFLLDHFLPLLALLSCYGHSIFYHSF